MTLYRIRLKEHLSERWRGAFAGLELRTVQVGERAASELSGPLDQAGLRDVLAKLTDLNLHLLSVDVSTTSTLWTETG